MYKNYDMDTRVEFLEERVRALEKRIDSTRLLSPGFFVRMLAVCGHAALGYFLIVFIYSILRRLLEEIF